MFFGGKFLNGFAIGTLKACSTTYIGEVRIVENNKYLLLTCVRSHLFLFVAS
jgi:hypothetical protein